MRAHKKPIARASDKIYIKEKFKKVNHIFGDCFVFPDGQIIHENTRRIIFNDDIEYTAIIEKAKRQKFISPLFHPQAAARHILMINDNPFLQRPCDLDESECMAEGVHYRLGAGYIDYTNKSGTLIRNPIEYSGKKYMYVFDNAKQSWESLFRSIYKDRFNEMWEKEMCVYVFTYLGNRYD